MLAKLTVEEGLDRSCPTERFGYLMNTDALGIRVPVLYLHPGFHVFQAIRTDEFL